MEYLHCGLCISRNQDIRNKSISCFYQALEHSTEWHTLTWPWLKCIFLMMMMIHSGQVYVLSELHWFVKVAPDCSPVIGQIRHFKCEWRKTTKEERIKKVTSLWYNCSVFAFSVHSSFCHVISSTERWKVFGARISALSNILEAHAHSTLKKATVEYSDWQRLFWSVPSLGNNND